MRNSLRVPHSTERRKVTKSFPNTQYFSQFSYVNVMIFWRRGTACSPQRRLYGGRRTRVPRPPDKACDGRQTFVRRPPHNGQNDIKSHPNRKKERVG